MARPPVRPYRTTPLGDYGVIRTDPATASCGVGKHPCRHQGVDLVAPIGTVVQSPADGWVIVSQATNNPPFQGYGPAVVLIAHDDRKHHSRLPSSGQFQPLSMRYSLLAHLDPDDLRYQLPYKKAEDTLVQSIRQAVGVSHPRFNADWGKSPSDESMLRIRAWPSWAIPIKEGEWVGKVGDTRHVHWEVRSQPLGGDAARLDPRGWLSIFDPSQDWEHAAASKVVPSGKGGGGVLLIVVALGVMFGDR